MSDIILQLINVNKSFSDTKVLSGINLDVRKGEFITLLGPSGCGKTTTLRIIAGLEMPDTGQVFISGQDVTNQEPNKRNVNMVFQNYALFPHMNVEQNIGYSLKLKRVEKQAIRQAVQEALELVQLENFERRMPSELSGGQQQRVAIARAIVNQPALLLLDEPLGALDLQLRRQMQFELKRLQKRLGVTFIYITHDQEEALNMSDRIAVMRNGGFEQIGTPSEVYDRPKTSYVASFVGSANIIDGAAICTDGEFLLLKNKNGTGLVPARGTAVTKGQPLTIAVRRELVTLLPSKQAQAQPNGLCAIVKEKVFAGGMLQVTVALPDGSELVSSRQGIDLPFAPGERVLVTWSPEHAVLVDLESPEFHEPFVQADRPTACGTGS